MIYDTVYGPVLTRFILMQNTVLEGQVADETQGCANVMFCFL